MSRTDAKQLNVPAVPSDPGKDENLKDASKPESEVNSILDSIEKTKEQLSRCPGCNSKLSEIERKMGSCFTCNTSVDVAGASPETSNKPSPKFEVRL